MTIGAIASLLRYVPGAVGSILARIIEQSNVIEEQAVSPIQAMIQAVTGGIWRGNGANKFVDELSSLIIPDINQTNEIIQRTHNDLSRASEIIERADEEVCQLINSRLTDAFAFY